MPRDWRKTTMGKWANIWRYLQNNEVRILIPSENENLGSRFLDFMERQVLNNGMLRWLYPELGVVDKGWTRSHRWSTTQCELPRKGIYSEPTFTIIGVGGAAQSGHYDFICPDDIIGKKAMESPVVMEGIFRWIDNMHELLVDPMKGVIEGVGTFWAVGDAYCYIEERYPEFTFYVTPALKDETLKDRPRSEKSARVYIQNPTVGHNESNFPEVFPTEYYIDMQAHPEKQLVFWSQHQNNPEKASGFNKIEADWFKFYTLERRDKSYAVLYKDREGNDKERVLHPTKFPLFGCIDPGGWSNTKRLSKKARMAFVIAGQPKGELEKFVFYTWSGMYKSLTDFFLEVFKAHTMFYPFVHSWTVEDIAAQAVVLNELLLARKNEDFVEQFKIGDFRASGFHDVSENAKDLRIHDLVQPFFLGEYYLLHGQKDLQAELKSFPTGLTKDLADCLAILNKKFFQRRERRSGEREFTRQNWRIQDRGQRKTGY